MIWRTVRKTQCLRSVLLDYVNCKHQNLVKRAHTLNNSRQRLLKLVSRSIPIINMSNITTMPNNIQISLIKPEDSERILEFLRIQYYPEEPLNAGIEPKRQEVADEEYTMSMITHGLSLMAVQSIPQNSKGHIVGAAIVGPKDAKEAEHLFDAAKKAESVKWSHMLQMLACVERDANVCELYKVQRVLHNHAIGVEANMRGKNVGARLIAEMIKVAKDANFEAITADCTSFYSAKLFERLGFECINTIYYDEYKDKNKQQVFRPEPPHTYGWSTLLVPACLPALLPGDALQGFTTVSTSVKDLWYL
uniref:aralkylamine N-acetyltransferase n=1 Tax=Glossina brevipalpis TaxID=37001 RepID=A0A1A9WFL7_9MUSC